MLRKSRSVALRLMLTKTPVYHRLASPKARSFDLPQEIDHFRQKRQSSKHPVNRPGVACNLPSQQREANQSRHYSKDKLYYAPASRIKWQVLSLESSLPGANGNGTEPTLMTQAIEK